MYWMVGDCKIDKGQIVKIEERITNGT
jgi:hypothetical protein